MNNISQIMKQAKEMQERMNDLQKKIEQETVEGTAGGGLVKVTINGKHNAKKVFIDQSLLIKEESDVLEDLIVAAINLSLIHI